MSPADDIASHLASAGIGALGSRSKWRIGIATEPTSPADCITLYDDGGTGPDTDELDVLRARIQVRVRAIDYREGYSKQVAIRELLVRLPPTVIDGTRYAGVVMSSDIAPLGRDDNDRHIFVANYWALMQPAT